MRSVLPILLVLLLVLPTAAQAADPYWRGAGEGSLNYFFGPCAVRILVTIDGEGANSTIRVTSTGVNGRHLNAAVGCAFRHWSFENVPGNRWEGWYHESAQACGPLKLHVAPIQIPLLGSNPYAGTSTIDVVDEQCGGHVRLRGTVVFAEHVIDDVQGASASA